MQIFPRPFKYVDFYDIFKWRNDKKTISNSKYPRKIRLYKHIVWFLLRIKNKNFIGIIFENHSHHKLGLVTFSKFDSNSYLTSININPNFRGKGLARDMILGAINKADFKSVTLYAEIKNNNIRSIKAFKRAGFNFLEGSKTEDMLKFFLKIR